VSALQQTAREAGMRLKILEAVESVNSAQKSRLLEKITSRFGVDLRARRFAVWGLAFKPNTDDMREAPSQVVVRGLVERGAAVTAYDPVAIEQAQKAFAGLRGVRYASSPIEALDGADSLVILTEWKEFRSPDFTALRARLASPVIFDGRNLFEPSLVRAQGFEYYGIGR
jgi:UDPglucose 6-dehydrogenase